MHMVNQLISFNVTYILSEDYCPKAVIIARYDPVYLPEMKYIETCALRSYRSIQETVILTTMYCIRYNEILNEIQ